jgi:hypothetical protein
MRQRLAWARDHRVTPPDYALAEAKAEGIDWQAICAAGPSDGCTNEIAAGHTCCARETKSCCSHHTHSEPCDEHSDAAQTRDVASTDGVILIQALKCHGGDQTWSGLTISSLPPREMSVDFSTVPTGQIAVLPRKYSSRSIAPATPPPEFVCG